MNLMNIFKSRDKPRNSTPGQSYGFLFGGTSSGKSVNERSAMQMTAVYACVRILSEAIAGLLSISTVWKGWQQGEGPGPQPLQVAAR